MRPPLVGLMTIGDPREHEWQHYFRGLTEPRHEQAVRYFQGLPVELHAADGVARANGEIDRQADALKAAGVEALVVHIPCWTFPNLTARVVQRLGVPTLLISNKHAGTHGTVGLLGAAGTLDQIGVPHLRIRGDFEGAGAETILEKALPFFRAAATVARLRGKVFGLFGGRSLGIDTATFDPMQWKKLFGVDVEHIDQLEIIRRAELVSEEQAERMVAWLTNNVASIAYNGAGLTPEKLAFQSRCYLATREIAAEKQLDFVAVKCMPDLTTHYVPQCLTAALMPGPFDADGAKEPMMMACEADGDAAVTMEVLKHVSGGLPVLFMDVSYIDDEAQTFYLPNCGALCAWYARRSPNAAENLKQVELRPAMRPGGGAITYFTPGPGELTLARFYRKDGAYRMAIFTGELITPSDEKYASFVQARGTHQLPTAFVKAAVNIERFIDEYASNHICGVAGRHTAALVHVCQMLNITPVLMNEGR